MKFYAWQMTTPPSSLRVHLQAHRERAGLSRSQLAQRAGLSRQAVHSIETGLTVPSTLIALQLARALGAQVEDLFCLPDPSVSARWLGEQGLGGRGQRETAVTASQRVRLARVGEQWLALALQGEAGLHTPADGVTLCAQGEMVSVTPLLDLRDLQGSALIAGCDPSLALLGRHAARLHPESRLLWRDLPSLHALQALARGEAHAAAIHLWDPRSGESNYPFVVRELRGQPTSLITLWAWEQGLIVARGNPKGIRIPADLARPGLSLVNRETGAGSRMLLDAWLEQAGLGAHERAALCGYDVCQPTHLALAQSIARGEADVGPGPRAAANAYGLDFIPIQRERFDLVVPDPHRHHPGIQALLAAVTQPAFQAELSALGGYDPSHAGAVWRTTS